ncbi:MAG: formyltetrahydrofolate deformylase [Chthoniobacterales bacterium]
MQTNRLVLNLDCRDSLGLVAKITSRIAALGLNLIEVNQHTDIASGWFFARIEMEAPKSGITREQFTAEFLPLASELNARWTVRYRGERVKTAILVSKADHCLDDLLWRWRSGELPMDIVAIISNHPDCAHLARREGIPFEEVRFSENGKDEAFAKLESLIHSTGAELIILARFMQVLPPALCEKFHARIINIHHSFLPAFTGGNPYARAYERGVKLIGATCHYVTPELDAGPIIEQEVVRVEHFHDTEDMKRLGRDCERLALGRGVRYHLENRILLYGQRTVVFRD